MKMRSFFFVLLGFLAISVHAQTSLYTHPDFDAIAETHSLIGIVPFDATVKLRPKDMKDISTEQLERMEIAEGENLQNAMYAWFLRRGKQGKLYVRVQDPSTTMAKLTQAGIETADIPDHTPQELCEILGVDALISGTLSTDKPMSEGASAALGVLVGFWGSTNSAVVNMYVHNAADGEVLVNYHKRVVGSLGSNTDQLINVLMRKASRRIAYTKKRKNK